VADHTFFWKWLVDGATQQAGSVDGSAKAEQPAAWEEILPRLTRFYGGDWTRRPVWIAKAHVAMLPRLEAEEAMMRATEVAIGTGSMEKKEAKRMMGIWGQTARGRTEERKKPVFNLAAMAACGIRVQKVKP